MRDVLSRFVYLQSNLRLGIPLDLDHIGQVGLLNDLGVLESNGEYRRVGFSERFPLLWGHWWGMGRELVSLTQMSHHLRELSTYVSLRSTEPYRRHSPYR